VTTAEPTLPEPLGPARNRPAPRWLVPCLALAATAMGIVLARRIGGMTDSVEYLFAARHLRGGQGYRGLDGNWLADFPPLYPATIALVSMWGLDVLTAARIVGVAGFVVVALGCQCWARLLTRSWYAGATAGVAVLLAAPVVLIYANVWSEALFSALVVVAGAALTRALLTPRIGSLAWSGIAAAAAVATRYVGVGLVPIGVAATLLLWPGGRRRRWAAALTWIAPVAASLVAIVAANLVETGTPTGDRPPATTDLATQLHHLVITVGTWLAPTFDVSDRTATIVGAMSLVIILAITILAAATLRRSRATRAEIVTAALPGAILVSLLATILWSSVTTSIDDLDTRLLGPLSFLLVVHLVVSVHRIASTRVARRPHIAHRELEPARTRSPRFVTASLIVMMVLIIGSSAVVQAERVNSQFRDGRLDALDPAWRHDPLVRWVRAHPDVDVTSNDPALLAWATGRTVQYWPDLPARSSVRAEAAALADFTDGVDGSGRRSALVWYRDEPDPTLLTRGEIAGVCRLRPVASFAGSRIDLVGRCHRART